MAAREIECDAEITCQRDNFHRSDIQDILFSSSHRTVVEHSSSTSSKKRPAGIRTCGCWAQQLQRAQRTSNTPANLVEQHFFLLIHPLLYFDSRKTANLIQFLKQTGLGFVRYVKDKLETDESEIDDIDVGLIGGLSLDLDF